MSFKRQSSMPSEDVSLYDGGDTKNFGNLTNKRFKLENNVEGQETPVIRPTSLTKLVSASKMACAMSPITEISLNLSDTAIGTPLKGWGTVEKKDGNLNLTNEEDGNDRNDDKRQNTNPFSMLSENFTSTNRTMQEQQKSKSRHARRLDMSALSFDDEDKNTMAIDDVSFYDTQSPIVSPSRALFPSSPNGLLSPECSPQRFTIVQNDRNLRVISKLRSLEEIDSNSVDSGYGTTNSFKFAEPLLQQRLPSNGAVSAVVGGQIKQKLTEPSPRNLFNNNDNNKNDKTSPKSYRIYHSLSSGSMESIDDDYMELFEMESLDDEGQQLLPTDLNSLISGAIKTIRTTPEIKRPAVRRCLSLTENNTISSPRNGLFEPKTPEILKTVQENMTATLTTTPYNTSRLSAERCFKRPEPPSATASPVHPKRYKGTQITCDKENTAQLSQLMQQRLTMRKCLSLNDAQIMSALSRSSSEPDLIGDFSKPYTLPLMDGRHQDLKSISSNTMAGLIRGDFDSKVASYRIIDCRYPYEFEGGHIRGAENLYTHEQIIDELVNCKTETATVIADGPKRNILVFHCEFSSERGPKLSRFLRNHDRTRNSNEYPALHYPEIYLLHNGYKDFYETHSDLCDPIAYRPMLDPSYGEDLKNCRAKSKSWNGEVKSLGGSTNRLKKSRSRLVL